MDSPGAFFIYGERMKCMAEGTATISGTASPVPLTDDERHMLRAIELAERGRGRTSPNPMVGAVVVASGEVAGEGFHEGAGAPHAEINALSVAGDRARGSTLYVTLEPCNHFGRTPPCAEAIIRNGVSRVVMGMRDPNPAVEGGGKERLEVAGIEVMVGPLGELVVRQNEAYVKWVLTGLPFVTLKMAMSFDGKIATGAGDSRWITCDAARRDVHIARSASDAVMVGIGTVLVDDPRLTPRMGVEVARRPLRVVVDSNARTPLESNVAHTDEAPTLVAVAEGAPVERVSLLQGAGVAVVRVGNGRVDLRALLVALGELEVTSLMVEGGGELAATLLDAGLIDKFVFYVAPLIIGGGGAPGPFGGSGVEKIAEARRVEFETVEAVGRDIKIVAYPAGGD